MSVLLVGQALKYGPKGHLQHLLVMLADFADDDGYCWPRYATLAERLGSSRRTVERNVARLVKGGWLEVTPQFRSDGSRRSSLLRVVIDVGTPPTSVSVPPDIDVGTPRHERRDPPTLVTGHEPSLEPPYEPPVEPPRDTHTLDGANVLALVEPSSPAVTVRDFDEFWAVYPRKVGKRDAKGAWKVAVRSVGAQTVLAGAIRYRDDPNRSDGFTAHPATWLRGGRWEDDPLPERVEVQPKRRSKTRDNLDTARSWETGEAEFVNPWLEPQPPPLPEKPAFYTALTPVGGENHDDSQ